ERLGGAVPPASRGDHRVEQAHRYPPRVPRPPVVNLGQPVGVRGTPWRRGGRRLFPGGVREEEVDMRRLQRGQGGIGGERVVAYVYGAQQAGEQRPETLGPQ